MASTPLGCHAVGILRFRSSPIPSERQKHSFLLLIRSSHPNCSPTSHCRLPPVGRRRASLGLLLLLGVSSSPSFALAGSPFDKYVKRKILISSGWRLSLGFLLTTQIPSNRRHADFFEGNNLISRVQTCFMRELFDAEDYLDVEQPKYDISRSLLRSGPAGSLRINMRAVAQYADDDGKGKIASDAVDRCLRALEDLDSLLLRAARNDSSATIKSMKDKVNVALESLDSLLQTVPSSVLDKGKAIADSYRVSFSASEENKSEDLDPELKKLEEIL